MLVDTIAEDLDELLQDGGLTSVALLREFGRIVVVAVDVAFVLVVRILSAKDGRADTAGEVLNVILAVQSGDVRASKRTFARVTEQIEATEVVRFAQRVLIRRLIRNGEELGGYDLVAVLRIVSQQTSQCAQGRLNLHGM